MIASALTVWRDGFLPSITTEELERLLTLLEENSPKLLQGMTTKPPPLTCVLNEECLGACAAGCTAMTPGATVGDVEEQFAKLCFEADERLGEPAACRYFLSWWDDTPRHVAIKELLTEVRNSLHKRKVTALLGN